MKKAILVVIIILAVMVLGFVLYKYLTNPIEPIAINNNNNSNQTPPTPITTPTNNDWQTITNNEYGFSLQYPKDDVLKTENQYSFLTQNSLVTISLPDSYYQRTNLGEAQVIIGTTSSPTIVANCLKPFENFDSNVGQTKINGVDFEIFAGVDVGAGNIYENKNYRAVHNNKCYEIILFRHSGNIANYPEGAVKEFDKTVTLQKLQNIADTFKFI